MVNYAPKRALVLSGGSVKGAFQAGALPIVLKNFTPDLIYGISVGSLNGAFLAERAGREIYKGKKKHEIDWVAIAEELEETWLTRINKPKHIFKNKKLKLLWEILSNKFSGIVDCKPMRKLLKELLDPKYLALSPVDLRVGSVNMKDGSIFYAKQNHSDILELIYASAAIPGIFPPVAYKDESTMIDGAMRASAPICRAIDEKANDIVAILCHAVQLNENEGQLGNAKNFFERLMDIFSNEQITNDILIANLRRQIMELENETGRLLSRNKRAALLGQQCADLNLRIIRPGKQPAIKMGEFDINDIEGLTALGRKMAQETITPPKRTLEPELFY